MLKILVSFMLGPWGLKILYFYLEHDAIINSIVFVYGIFLVTAHLNFRKISDHIYKQIPKNAAKKPAKKTVQINLEKAIEENKMFPFVAGQVTLFPKKTSSDAVKKFLLKEKKWKELVGNCDVNFID